jgi:hypothetical protein
MADKVDSQPKTIILAMFYGLTRIYEISPVWLVVSFLKKRQASPETCATVTDVFVIGRMILAGLLLILLPASTGLAIVAIAMILELFFAYLAHFLSTDFNSAGPGKTTNPVRTFLIVILNGTSFILLYGYLFKVAINLSPFDSFYISLGTMVISGFGGSQISTLFAKLISCGELVTGLFLIVFVVATIVRWFTPRASGL